MYNRDLERLTDYPFDRLRALLGGIEPPASAKPVIMSLGEPQHAPPTLIQETVAAHADGWAKYPPVAGSKDLLDAVTDWIGRRYGLTSLAMDPVSNIVAVNGTKEALFMAGDICVPRTKNGRRPAVLIPNPFYQVYVGAAILRDAEPVYLSATKETGFLPDLENLDVDLLDRTALAFLCTPANPQGAIADLNYLTKALELARKHDFVLAVDECYAEIYDKIPPPGGLEAAQSLDQGLENLLVFHSLSKRSNAPGLRSGFVAGDPQLISAFRTLRNYGGAAVPLPLLAASAALWRDENHVHQNRIMYRDKFDRADQILRGKFGYYRPEGGFYLWLDVINGEDAARRLWTEGAIRVIPGAYLARPGQDGTNPGNDYVRIALVQEPDEIDAALTRLVAILQ